MTTRLTPVAGWKEQADFLFVQACFDLDALLRWRDAAGFAGRVFAGVLVPPSAARARKWAAEIPEISIPASWVAALDADPAAGIRLACDLAARIRDSGAFDGLHLIPGVKHREVAFTLESILGVTSTPIPGSERPAGRAANTEQPVREAPEADFPDAGGHA